MFRVSYIEPDAEIIVPEEKKTTQKGFGNTPGWNLFPAENPFIYIVGKRSSGKTVLLLNMLARMTSPGDVVLVISSTYEVDDTWRQIEAVLRHKKVRFENVEVLVGSDPLTGIKSDNGALLRKTLRKQKEEGVKIPRTFVILDDLEQSQLRSPSFNALAKTARHYRISLILATQYAFDIAPQARAQVDFCLLFPKIAIKKIKSLRNDFDIDLPEEQFVKLYKAVTAEPHDFLYIKRNPLSFRKNLDTHIEVTPEEED